MPAARKSASMSNTGTPMLPPAARMKPLYADTLSFMERRMVKLNAKFESASSCFDSSAETKRGQAGIKLGSSWGQFGVNLGSIWGHAGVKMGSTWGQFGVNLGSTWGQPGVNLGSTGTAQP